MGGDIHCLPPPYPPTLYVQGLKNRKILKTEHEEENCMQGTTRKAGWGDSVVCQIPTHL